MYVSGPSTAFYPSSYRSNPRQSALPSTGLTFRGDAHAPQTLFKRLETLSQKGTSSAIITMKYPEHPEKFWVQITPPLEEQPPFYDVSLYSYQNVHAANRRRRSLSTPPKNSLSDDLKISMPTLSYLVSEAFVKAGWLNVNGPHDIERVKEILDLVDAAEPADINAKPEDLISP